MTTVDIREDFAAGGGVSEGLRLLGLADRSVGIELKADPVATARAAGHQRWHASVTGEAVRDWRWGRLWGYHASPECQTFSTAGKGEGAKHMAAYVAALEHVANGMTPEAAVALVNDDALNVSAMLSLEPMLVIYRHRPTWITLEQTPKVLPLWGAYAKILAGWGYNVWTGYLTAEMYGVPQTRKRAILMAHKDREVAPPTPTHSRYYSRDPKRLDSGVAKWVSMAEALSDLWYADDLVGFPRRSDGKEEIELDGVALRARDLRPADRPAQVVTEKARSWQRFRSREDYRFAGAGRTAIDTSGQVPRGLDLPAHTLTGKGTAAWVPTAAVEGDTSWAYERPSVVGSFAPDVLAAPGYRKAGDGPRQAQPGSIRVTAQEAAVLQSFRADYPWQGAKTSQFQQIGNAVPPLLARAVIGALLGIPLTAT